MPGGIGRPAISRLFAAPCYAALRARQPCHAKPYHVICFCRHCLLLFTFLLSDAAAVEHPIQVTLFFCHGMFFECRCHMPLSRHAAAVVLCIFVGIDADTELNQV